VSGESKKMQQEWRTTEEEENMSAKPNPSILDASSREYHGTAARRTSVLARKSADNGPRKILLPRRPGEPKFAPRQYYYPASRSGVVPNGRFAA
jgi:hypothetical protein